MKRRFGEEQIIAIPREQEAGSPVKEVTRTARHIGAVVLPLEGEIRRDGGLGRAAAERFGVAPSTAVRWARQWFRSGSVDPRPRGRTVAPTGPTPTPRRSWAWSMIGRTRRGLQERLRDSGV